MAFIPLHVPLLLPLSAFSQEETQPRIRISRRSSCIWLMLSKSLVQNISMIRCTALPVPVEQTPQLTDICR